tara:strand:- start:3615 stop:4115 length:501 start_codon:yes stop_codon:yes gene_type:complete
MINFKNVFNKLLKDIEESSPSLRNTLIEISPINFCINLEGHKKIFISLNGDNSNISLKENDTRFEISGSLIEIIYIIVTGKINKNLIKGDAELAIVFFSAIYKSNIDLIYLIDKYFGNLPAVFTYAIVKTIFKTPVIYKDDDERRLRGRLRDISIRLDRLEAVNKR